MKTFSPGVAARDSHFRGNGVILGFGSGCRASDHFPGERCKTDISVERPLNGFRRCKSVSDRRPRIEQQDVGCSKWDSRRNLVMTNSNNQARPELLTFKETLFVEGPPREFAVRP